ncbi:hypothetical protein LVJ82_12415 [Vitreoscilla massiliensis]|uniref:PilY1 beta-propeller domain-containing protein n=1 Tax=Vitreoscilla massiliensis TaxID=1689272 RepID=A0ABY4DYE0_9NEIS|nr:PilC/PilY family type IV pilus protein [Vitreoscilla massiliensis]UOO88274.1 hypothetical protein LVJ82_12415 [Vitreoscilla massiliensis]
MLKKSTQFVVCKGLLCLPLLLGNQVFAKVISEDFRGATTSHNWIFPKIGGLHSSSSSAAFARRPNQACLTAGDGKGTGSITQAGKPPRCSSRNDTTGNGALRLTPADLYQSGGIVSDFTFATDEGVEISFTTYTYGGTGADGMSFALIDGAAPITLGGLGGALGYSCPATGYNERGSGMRGAYLGVGIDEWGNFLNRNDNSGNGPFGNTNAGYIGIRGKGDINLEYLNTLDRSFFPLNSIGENRSVSLCKDGRVSGSGKTHTLASLQVDNYKVIDYVKLPSNMPIGSKANNRSQAIPINYRLKITSEGLLSFWWSYNGGAYQPLLIDKNIISSNGKLPSSFRFAFAGATGGSTNNHEVTCFKAAPANLSIGTSPSNTPDGEFRTDTQVFSAYYNSNYWIGNFTATTLTKTAQGGLVASSKANWDGACGLLGGACAATDSDVSPLSPANRVLWTSKNGDGIAFKWSQLDKETQKILDTGDNLGEERVAYLQGVRTYEGKTVGSASTVFRERKGILGDIVHAGAAVIGPPKKNQQYQNTWRDQLYPELKLAENKNGAQTYQQFTKENNDRLNVAYIGANDGFVHGFRAGAYDATGKRFIGNDAAKPNDGREVLAFMPNAVLKRVHGQTQEGLNLSNTRYAHNYYHDSAIGSGDVFYQNQWHTWLVSGLGNGGATVYALDVTRPDFHAGNASEHVLGEWSYDSKDSVWQYLGNTYGKPEAVRLHNGQWGFVFGNGWCEDQDAANGNCSKTATGEAGIYLMLVDSDSGKIKFEFLNTKTGTAKLPNGIAEVTPVDLDGDNITDFIYAGDTYGNVWRFDVSAKTVSEWQASTSIRKLFQTQANQPISSKIVVTHGNRDKRVMLNFGTGKRAAGYLAKQDEYMKATQSLYGIWDSQLGQWNSKSRVQYRVLTSTTLPSRANLTKQTMDSSNLLSQNEVCWADVAACKGSPSHGWYRDLRSERVGTVLQYEQVVYNPAVYETAVLFNTYIDGVSSVATCEPIDSSGMTYGLDYSTGKGIDDMFVGTKGAYAMPYGAMGDVVIIVVDGIPYLQVKRKDGTLTYVGLKIPKEPTTPSFIGYKRLSWREIF